MKLINLNCGTTDEIEMRSSQLKSQFKKLHFFSPKKFPGLQRDSKLSDNLCVSAAVLYQLSFEDPYVGSRPISIELTFTRDRKMSREMKVI